MTQRTRLILAIVGAVLVCIAVYFLLVRTRQGELNELRVTIEEQEARTAQLRVELSRLRDLQRRAPELQAQLDRFRELVPGNHEIPNLIFQIDEAANEAGVEFLDITPELPRTPPEGAPLAQVRMSIGGEGGYFALQDFIRRLYDLDRAMRIDNLSLTGTSDQETGGVSISLEVAARVFFDLDGATGATGDTAANTPTTTTTPAPTPAPTP